MGNPPPHPDIIRRDLVRIPRGMLLHVLVYGLVGAVLTLALQLVEYRWLIIGHSFEIYGALVAVLFAAVGIWAGRKLVRPDIRVVERHVETVVVREVAVAAPDTPAGDFVPDAEQLAAVGLTPREREILEAIAAGLSNREIAQRLNVSENTVKTHSSRVFDKLGVQRRLQAAQKGRALRLIP